MHNNVITIIIQFEIHNNVITIIIQFSSTLFFLKHGYWVPLGSTKILDIILLIFFLHKMFTRVRQLIQRRQLFSGIFHCSISPSDHAIKFKMQSMCRILSIMLFAMIVTYHIHVHNLIERLWSESMIITYPLWSIKLTWN